MAPNFALKRARPDIPESEGKLVTKTLVLFFQWFRASSRAVHKYCCYYHLHNMDVLIIDTKLKHFLLPASGRTLALHVLDHLLKDHATQYENYFVHAFSIGAFLYTIVLKEIGKDPVKYGNLRNKIKAQVFDSLVDGNLKRMGAGVAEAFASPAVKRVVNSTVILYFKLAKSKTMKFYDDAVISFKTEPLDTPVLIFFCLNDPMCDSDVVRGIDEAWRDPCGIYRMDVRSKCWAKSAHAGHFKEHPVEYQAALDSFLLHVGLARLQSSL